MEYFFIHLFYLLKNLKLEWGISTIFSSIIFCNGMSLWNLLIYSLVATNTKGNRLHLSSVYHNDNCQHYFIVIVVFHNRNIFHIRVPHPVYRIIQPEAIWSKNIECYFHKWINFTSSIIQKLISILTFPESVLSIRFLRGYGTITRYFCICLFKPQLWRK